MTSYTSVFGNQAVPPAEQSYGSYSLTADTPFEWAELATGIYLIYELMDFALDAAWALTLPKASQVSAGRSATFKNNSAFTLTIKDYSGATATIVDSGKTKCVYLTDNSTDAGVWGAFDVGSGTTVADAAVLAGYGLKVVNSKIAVNSDAFSAITSYDLVSSDRGRALVFNSSGAVNFNLLQASVATNGFIGSVSNLGEGSVNIEPYGSELIDEASFKALAPGESLFYICDGTGWVTVGHGRSTQFQFTKLVFDVSSGTPFTLTSTQAQNKLMQFIGTVTGNVVVNVPAVVAVYYVQCSYSGAFSLTLKTAAGGGVVLATGDRAILYCDGIDVVSAQTSAVPATDLSGGVAGAVVYQAGVGNTAFTSAGTAGQVLTSQGTSAPTWSNLDFSSFAGTVPVNKGGTGATTLTTGGLLRGNGASPVSIASAADIVAAIGATKVQAATSADNGGVTSVNGQTGAVTITAGVTSVAGKTGVVTLAKGDVGLGNVDNTADVNKSVNYAASAGNADTLDGYHYNNLPYAAAGAYATTAQALASVTRYANGDYVYLRNTKVNGSFTNELWVYVAGGGGGG